MDSGFTHASLTDLMTNPDKPGTRWEVSPQLGIMGYNFNVAVLEPGDRLSQNAFHAHANQEEFFFVVSGRCRVETATDSFDCNADEMVLFRRGAVHLLHNPYEEPCRSVAIGYPATGRRPVESVADVETLLKERYPDGDVGRGPAHLD
ncbi:MAG: cupin domain-containing protein [Halobacteriales archaeon]|nr:cupin domain-containing protein [Halobacteriales archaeon]